VTVYLAPPVSDGQRLRPLLRLMLEGIVSALTTSQSHTADGRPKQRPVLALIDEFPQLGRMSAVEFKMPVAAGYGVRFCLVCQDEEQIGSLYGSKQSITANCSTIAYYPGFSGGSLQTVARWGGTHAIAHSSKQLAASLRGSSSRSQSEAERPLLDPGEMLKRSKKEVLVFVHGVAPTYLRKGRGYWREGEFRGRWDVQGTGNRTGPQITPVQLPEPEQMQNEPVDKLEPDEQSMLDSIEQLLKDVPVPVRRRLGV
jgi:type IV secretion system protein VirD4